MQTKTALTIIVSDCYGTDEQTQADGWTEAVEDDGPSLQDRSWTEGIQTKARSEGRGECDRMDVSIAVISHQHHDSSALGCWEK